MAQGAAVAPRSTKAWTQLNRQVVTFLNQSLNARGNYQYAAGLLTYRRRRKR